VLSYSILKLELPYSDKLPIEKLSVCFSDTTNAYKFYWFLSILDHLLENGNPNIAFKDIAIRMIANAWYPLDYFKLSFGKQDGFKKIATSISNKIKVDNLPNSPSLFKQLNQKLSASELDSIYKNVYQLLRWVPFRFIRPFFKESLIGLRDSQVNSRIEELANSKKNMNGCPYYFGENEIIIWDDWYNYFQSHQVILRHFTKWNLIKFLQKNNPNVIGLSEKLEKPSVRNMRQAKLYWKTYLDQKQINCIYTNLVLDYKSFSLDHFLPWTFVAHDQIWNLIPTTKSVNSLKSNWLPSLEEYLSRFTELQFDVFKFHFLEKNFQLLEDYSSLLGIPIDKLNNFNASIFEAELKQKVIPLFETARNLGFNYPFIYRK
jgi:hypothetical protein